MTFKIAVLCLAASLCAAQRGHRIVETPKPEPVTSPAHWKLQFFHDKIDSTLNIVDLKFPSPKRGIALGFLVDKGKPKPTVLVTNTGGDKWDYVSLSENGVSLFFLNEQDGWLVTEKGIWKTEEAGRNWHKLSSLKGVRRVHFISSQKGFAVGYPKAVYETDNGGKTWKKVPAAEKPGGNPQYTAYNVVDFTNSKAGIIIGASQPPRRMDQPEVPAWMDPGGQSTRRQWPSLTILLQTRDGGVTWDGTAVSIFGTFTRLSTASDARGLALIEFLDTFEFPSEVHSVDLRDGKLTRVFLRKDLSVTDVAVIPDGPGYLAAIEPPGTLYHTPIPGKLKILVSDTFYLWREMSVDYRVTATRAVLATAGKGNVWAGTDTGMILRLVE